MVKSIKILFSFFILSFCLSIQISAADIKFQRVFNTNICNNCIVQDKDGLFWVGTWGKGLLCYNGYNIKQISGRNNELATKIIPSVFIDREGLIWFFALGDGLYVYNKTTGLYKNYKPNPLNSNSLSSNRFYWLPNIITEDKEGLIWVGTADGLNSFDKKTKEFTQYKNIPDDKDSLSNNSIWAVLVDHKGLIWAGTEDGLNCYNKKSGKFTTYKHDPEDENSISGSFIQAIAEDIKGNLWIGTKKSGINKFDRTTNTFTRYKHKSNDPNSLSSNEIYHILIDQPGNLWIAHPGGFGITIYDPQLCQFQKYTCDPKNANSLSSNDIISFFKDKLNNVWVVDYLGGIDRAVYKNQVINVYGHNLPNSINISSNVVIGLYEDKDKNIWMGTHDGGLCVLNTHTKRIENFKHKDNDPFSLPHNAVYSITGAFENKVWLGIDNGNVCLFDAGIKQVVKTFRNPYSADTPRNLTKDNKDPNIIWFSTLFDGIFKLNTEKGKFIQYNNTPGDKNSLSSDSVLSLLQTGDNLWIGTYGGGLNKFNKKTCSFTQYKHSFKDKNSIGGDIVIYVYIDTRGAFWVSTGDGGLNRFNEQTERFVSYGTSSGFPSNTIEHILEDDNGYLWISTNAGIVKFDTQNLKVVKVLTKEDGLPDNDFDIYTNALKDSSGNLWFSTMHGVCEFNPKIASSIKQNLNIPPVVLSSFKSKEGTYNNRGFKVLRKVNLPWFDNSFEFTFAVLDYVEPERNQYAYKLEGFDNTWHHIETNHFGQYANLSPGKYILHLIGANNNGVWNKNGTSITIIIELPFWETLWFRGIIAIIFLGITLLIVQHKRKIQKKRVTAMRDHTIANITSAVAHDVRKPFMGLKMMLQMLPTLTPAETKDYSEDLDISIRKVDAILTDIMEASRGMRYELVPGNILGVLDFAIKDVSRYHPNKYVDFYYNLDIVALIALDEQRMCRAFENIIDNAFGYLPKKKGFMWFSVRGEKRVAKIIIGNSHSHIPENKIKKVFEDRFTSGKKGGTGLGLSIVTKVIKGHNGLIRVRNVKNAPGLVPENIRDIQGVEFEITLPLTDKYSYSPKDPLLKNSLEAKASLGMMQKKSQLAGSSEIDTLIKKLKLLKHKPNLLILDDESIYRMRVRDVLGNLGDLNKFIHVYDAGSYEEAIDVLDHTKIDYLLCDIDLSDKKNDGFSVLSKTLKKYSNSKVLIHTNRKESEDINKAKTLGACGFCPKPITEAILVDLLLDKKLWDYDSSKSKKAKENIMRCVKGVPNSSILIVNDDPLALKLTLMIIKSHIDPEDNISIYTAGSYTEAKVIIDNKKLDMLISDFNLNSSETGVDVCQHMKEKQSESVCIIYSGISRQKIEELKKINKDYIDDVFSTSYEIKEMLSASFKVLRKKK
jgi:ligand-binding sensor domain-containing protein/signal transduction histidine kinase/CheY-like chemotaxis protein